jgi:hypothetical protein
MRMVRWSFMLFALAIVFEPCVAVSDSDAAGNWKSTYDFGPVVETMTANIQQVGNNLIGSFSVDVSPSGEEYGGIIFGTIDSGKIQAYYLATRSSGEGDPLVTISFTDGRMMNEDTIRGEFYYRDSDMTELSGPYEAERI